MAWALNFSLDVEFLALGVRISILVLCGSSTCLISFSIAQRVLDQKWPIGVSVTSAQMATGMWPSWDKWSQFGIARPVLPLLVVPIQKQADLHRCYFHFVAYLLPEQLFSMLDENGLCAEILSGCAVLNAWSEDLYACFVWDLNMLDFIFQGSMGMDKKWTIFVSVTSAQMAAGMWSE